MNYVEGKVVVITGASSGIGEETARVLTKNGFEMVVHAVPEDWGYEKPVIADKWIR